MDTQAEEAHQKAVSNFSPAAKEADAKLSLIANSSILKSNEKQQQIVDLLNKLPKDVRAEIDKAMQG